MTRILPALLLMSALAAADQPATLDLRIEGESLSILIERIAGQCQAGLSVHHRVVDRLAAPVTIDVRAANWSAAMALLRDQYDIAVRLDGDRLVVDEPDREIRRSIVSKRYDIRHLMQAKAAYPGHCLATPEPGSTGSRLLPPVAGDPGPEALTLIGVILKLVAPGGWDEGRGTRIIDEGGGFITVCHVPEVQAQVAALLRECEAPLQRQVQVRLWRMPATVTMAGEVLDRAAFSVVAKAIGNPALAFLAGDGQQCHGYAGIQRAIIADVDVVQRRIDPIVTTVEDGISLDIQAQSTRSGIIATCRLDAATSATQASSPLRDVQGKAIAPIDQPDRAVESLRCTLLIPDGGAAILRFGDRLFALQTELHVPGKR